MIDALPTGRSFQNLSVLVPGVHRFRSAQQDVGGTGGERYQTLSVHGSRGDQMPLVMNGMPYNNMNNTGGGYNTTLVINTGTVQEMTVTTSGLSAEVAVERRAQQHDSERRRQHVPRLLLRQLRQQQPAERQPDRRPESQAA